MEKELEHQPLTVLLGKLRSKPAPESSKTGEKKDYQLAEDTTMGFWRFRKMQERPILQRDFLICWGTTWDQLSVDATEWVSELGGATEGWVRGVGIGLLLPTKTS